MSQLGGEPIGVARVDITANVAPLKAGLEQAKAEAAKAAPEIQAAAAGTGVGMGLGYGRGGSSAPTQQVAAGIDSVGDASERADQKANRLFLRLVGITGTVAAFYRLGQAIREGLIYYLETGADRAAKFKASLDLTDAKASIAAIDAQLETLQARLAKNTEGGVGAALNAVFGDNNGKLRQQITDLQQTRARVASAENARALRDKDAETEKAKASEKEKEDSIRGRIQSEVAQTLTKTERIRYEESNAIDEIEAQREGATERQKKLLDSLARAVRDSAQYRIREAREADDKTLESARRTAEQIARAYASAINSVRQQSNSMFGGSDIATDKLTEIAGLLTTIANQRSNIYPEGLSYGDLRVP